MNGKTMNKRLEQLIKTINLTPGKTKLIVLNKSQCTQESAYKLLEILKARGHSDASVVISVVMVDGDVRTAVEAWELPKKRLGNGGENGHIS